MSTTTRLRGEVASTPHPTSPSPHASTDPLVTGRLGAAQVRWNDYLGSAAADDSGAVLDTRSLYEIARLDRDRWTIVGIDLSLDKASDQVVMYAVDRMINPDEGAGIDEMGVTAIHLNPSTRVDEFLREAFERVSVRLMSTLAVDGPLRVDSHVELPKSTNSLGAGATSAGHQ